MCVCVQSSPHAERATHHFIDNSAAVGWRSSRPCIHRAPAGLNGCPSSVVTWTLQPTVAQNAQHDGLDLDGTRDGPWTGRSKIRAVRRRTGQPSGQTKECGKLCIAGSAQSLLNYQSHARRRSAYGTDGLTIRVRMSGGCPVFARSCCDRTTLAHSPIPHYFV